MDNIEDAIVSSLEDAEIPEMAPEPITTDSEPTDTLETAPEGTEAPSEATSEETSDSPEVPSPASQNQTQDDFEKKFGIPAQSASGRENRIPYSRVKKITEKAVKDAEAEWNKKVSSEYIPTAKFQELDTKVKDYENRLVEVARFEQVMMNDPNQFLNMLARIPAYRQIFESLTAQPEPQAPAQPQVNPEDEMPQPDQEFPDGTKGYSMEGLSKLNAWNRAQARKEVLEEVGKRFGPIEQEWQAHQRIQAVIPQVQRQIEEARQWPLFNESENEIVTALQQNPAWGLERAYQHVVLPKLQSQSHKAETDAQALRQKIRDEVIQEMKRAPRATSAPVSTSKAPTQRPAGGNRSLEDVIAASIKEAGLR